MSEEIRFRSLPPAWFIRLLSGFRRFLSGLSDHLFPASVVLYEQFQMVWLLPCLKVAAELDIAGILKEGPKTLEELSRQTGTHDESLFRVMRALCSQGIFRLRNDGRYVNTQKSKTLADGKNSIRHLLLHHLGNVNLTPLNELSYTVKTGNSSFSKVHGKEVYEFLSEHPEESAVFDKSMTDLTNLAIEPLLSAYPFGKFKLIADIGGGEGLLLSSILCKFRNLKGILYDLPEGIRNAEANLICFGVKERVTVLQGSFFDAVPPGADAYLLKNILHNWNDEKAALLLSNIKKVLPPHGKILMIEMIIDEGNAPSYGKLVDIQMMASFETAKERTLKEFHLLANASGLRISRVVPTIAPVSILELV
jgi:hypothetical protein